MLLAEKDDWSLLREYAERGSEAAFEGLVRRHLDMVYSTARRQTGDEDLAEETAQAVFILLARKAARLREGVVVGGWLYRTASLTAKRALRDEVRRKIKERKAAEMRTVDSHEDMWSQLMPHLDSELASLGEADRTVIVLRYLEKWNFRDVAQAMGTSEEAAQKRVKRALEKLRARFASKGLVLGAGALGILLTERATEAASARLLGLSVKAALRGGAGAGVVALVAGVLRDALSGRLKIFGVATVVILMLALLATWEARKNFGRPGKTGPANAREAGGAAANTSPRPLSPPAAATRAASAGRTMILHVLADESGEPLANVPVYVSFVIMPRSVPAKFVTDATGAARIVRPEETVDDLKYWVWAPERVPMTVFWNLKQSPVLPEYTLRLPQGRLVGGVVVDEAGKPVGGVKVHFEGDGLVGGMLRESVEYEPVEFMYGLTDAVMPAAVTDANGKWSADFISPRAKRLMGYLEHPEYAETKFGDEEPPGPIAPSMNVVLTLERGALVKGTVRNTAGAPITNATLELREMTPRMGRYTKSDEQGYFEFPHVGNSKYYLSVNAKGYHDSGDIEIPGGRATNVEVVLKVGTAQKRWDSVIRGAVLDEEGKPAAGVQISVVPNQEIVGNILLGMRTGLDGRFEWKSAPNRPVKMKIGDGINVWETQEVELKPDGTEAVIHLKKKGHIHLHGTVRDKTTGAPVPEFSVLFATGIANGYSSFERILTDGREGKFSADLLEQSVRSNKFPGSSSRLDFRARGYENRVVELAPGTNDIEVNVEIEPASWITGKVLGPDGQAASGANVFFRGAHFRFWMGNGGKAMLPTRTLDPVAATTEAAADGTFKLEKKDGADRLEAVHTDGWALVPLDAASTRVVRLQPWGRISGVVEPGPDGTTKTNVFACQPQSERDGMMFSLSAEVDAAGRFEFPKVPGGRALVFLQRPPGWTGTNVDGQEITVEAGQTTEVRLTPGAQ